MMRSKRAANSSSSRTIFSLLSFVLFLLLLGGGGGIVVVSVSSSFRRRRREERTEDIRCARASERALPCLLRVVSLCLTPFFFVTSRKRTNERRERERKKTKRDRRERERERTDPLCEPFAFWNLPATEIDFLLLGRSASLEIFFFFQRPPGTEEEKPFSTPPLETFALSLEVPHSFLRP